MIKKNNLKKFDISNKLAYILIAIFSFILIGVGVYAYGGSVPSTVGHSLGEIALPSCSVGQVLDWTGSDWSCLTLSSTDMRLSIEAGGVCYTTPVSTCAVTTQSCSNFFQIQDEYWYNCASNGATARTAECLARCRASGPACNGDTTSCPGGTTAQYNTVTYQTCGGVHLLICTCTTTNSYSQEGYLPAGTKKCM
jgi:hypothetical protein